MLRSAVVPLPYAKAVATFRSLKVLVAGPATPTRLGGARGVTFHARVKGSDAALEALGTDADIPGDVTGQQTFLNVHGRTLLIRTNLVRRTTAAARAELGRVFASFRLP